MTSNSTGTTPRQQPTEVAEQSARRQRERRMLGIVALVLVVIVVGGGIGLQIWRTGRAPAAAPVSTSDFAPAPVTDGSPLVLGKAGAPVRLQLYEDFHCPHCADFESELGPAVTAEQDAGTLAVELYPMSFIDEGSASAANAMACAAENGFGQSYYLGLFANHTLQWSDRQLTSLAATITDPVPAAFTSCVTSRAHQSWVDSINTAAQANGVTGTPTVFLNGSPVDTGSLTPESLKAMIDRAANQ